MWIFKMIIAASCLAAIFEEICSYPTPGHHHHRLIIYVPFKVKILHHYNVKKVPVHIEKTIHHHYDDYDSHESNFDEGNSNILEDESYQPEDDIQEQKNSQNFHEDYEESQKWETNNSDEYE